jgi:Flp pilus assembly protein CpaB
MIEKKSLIKLISSAILAFLLVHLYVHNKEQAIENSYDMINVLVATRDIPPHTAILPDFLTTRPIPRQFMEPGAVMVKILAQDVRRVQGKVTVAAVPTGAQILQSNLGDPSPNTSGVAPLIPPGKRGYLLRLGNIDVAELILPGDHIDIMATFSIKQNNAPSRATYTILQNVLVIGVGRELRKPGQDVSGKKDTAESLVLTLALEPTEAERLTLAQSESQGEISVVVRPFGDNSIKPVPSITPNRIIS